MGSVNFNEETSQNNMSEFEELKSIVSGLLDDSPSINAITSDGLETQIQSIKTYAGRIKEKLFDLIEIGIKIAEMTNNIQLNGFTEKSNNVFVFLKRLFSQDSNQPLEFFHDFKGVKDSDSLITVTHTNAEIILTAYGDCEIEVQKADTNDNNLDSDNLTIKNTPILTPGVKRGLNAAVDACALVVFKNYSFYRDNMKAEDFRLLFEAIDINGGIQNIAIQLPCMYELLESDLMSDESNLARLSAQLEFINTSLVTLEELAAPMVRWQNRFNRFMSYLKKNQFQRAMNGLAELQQTIIRPGYGYESASDGVLFPLIQELVCGYQDSTNHQQIFRQKDVENLYIISLRLDDYKANITQSFLTMINDCIIKVMAVSKYKLENDVRLSYTELLKSCDPYIIKQTTNNSLKPQDYQTSTFMTLDRKKYTINLGDLYEEFLGYNSGDFQPVMSHYLSTNRNNKQASYRFLIDSIQKLPRENKNYNIFIKMLSTFYVYLVATKYQQINDNPMKKQKFNRLLLAWLAIHFNIQTADSFNTEKLTNQSMKQKIQLPIVENEKTKILDVIDRLIERIEQIIGRLDSEFYGIHSADLKEAVDFMYQMVCKEYESSPLKLKKHAEKIEKGFFILSLFLFPELDQTKLYAVMDEAVTLSNSAGRMERSNVLAQCTIKLRKYLQNKTKQDLNTLSQEEAKNCIDENIRLISDSDKNKTTRYLNTQQLILRLKRIFTLLPRVENIETINLIKFDILGALFNTKENVSKDEVCYTLSKQLRASILNLYEKYHEIDQQLPIRQELHHFAFLFNQHILDYQERNEGIEPCQVISNSFINFHELKELKDGVLLKHHRARLEDILKRLEGQPANMKVSFFGSSNIVDLPIVEDVASKTTEYHPK